MATDPNRVCAESSRGVMMEDSQVVKNLHLPVAIVDFVITVREQGMEEALRYAADTLMEADGGRDPHVREPDFRAKLIEIMRSSRLYPSLPDFYDNYFILRGVTAVRYDPNIDRVTCHVNYQINYDFFEKWWLSLNPTPEQIAQHQRDMEPINQIRRFSPGGKLTMGKTFSVQPNGSGGIATQILSNN
jgi:hypothetical protein